MSQYLEFVVNHPVLFAALAAIIALIAWTEIRRLTSGAQNISPGEAVLMLNRENALLLDVREDAELAGGMIQGAKHIPLGALKQRLGELEPHKGKNIIIYCRSGHRSATACGLLRKHQFEKVYNLNGGVQAWQQANLPLVKR